MEEKIVDVVPVTIPSALKRKIKKRKEKKRRKSKSLKNEPPVVEKKENRFNEMDNSLFNISQLDVHMKENYKNDSSQSNSFENEKIEFDDNNEPKLIPQKRKRNETNDDNDDDSDEFELQQPEKKKLKTDKVVKLTKTQQMDEVSVKNARKERFKVTKNEKIEDTLLSLVDDNNDEQDEGEMLFEEDDDFLQEDDEFSEMIEKSKKIEEKRKEDKEAVEAEINEFSIEDKKELAIFSELKEREEKSLADSQSDIQSRIIRIVKVLMNFKQLKEEGYTRGDYLQVLKKDLCEYYGYIPDLIEKFFEFFSVPEVIEFLEASEKARPVTIRCNTLKTSRKQLSQLLSARGIDLGIVEGKWSKTALKIFDTRVPIGATPEYLAGYYIMQNPGSILPVLALDPKMNDVVLDMSAAPGVKTVHIGEIMKNSGVIFANDLNKGRMKGLVANIHRMGVRNTVIINYDARDLPQVVPKCDRVLLDAPCSGVGVISKDPSVKSKRDMRNIQKSANVQRELILSGVDCLKVGGVMVYSTCSILPDENEAIVDYCLRKRYVKIVQTNIHFGEKGFTKVKGRRFGESIKMAKRFYPHVHNIDGFFVCKIVKVREGTRMSEGQMKNVQKRKKKAKKMRREEKEMNIKKQKEREEYNKSLYEECLNNANGDEDMARELMKERKERISNKRKKFKKKVKKKWRKTS